MSKNATKNKPPKKNKKRQQQIEPKYTAANSDRHVLYGLSVQNVEAEVDFVDATFETIRGKKARSVREDFCGTANTCCEWVKRRPDNVAVGVDLDRATLDWAGEHNLPTLNGDQRSRVTLLERDVCDTGAEGHGTDVVLAMNFSYWIFRKREQLRAYFASVRESLADDGVFFLDFYGGSEALTEVEEIREQDGFDYVWDQARYDPISGSMLCHIHFKFRDGSKMKKAFTYEWRVWTLPEILEILEEAGFKKPTVYWEGEDPDNPEEGNGEFTPREVGDADLAFICYLVAEK